MKLKVMASILISVLACMCFVVPVSAEEEKPDNCTQQEETEPSIGEQLLITGVITFVSCSFGWAVVDLLDKKG